MGLLLMLYMAPAPPFGLVTLLALNVQLVTMGLPLSLNMAPASQPAYALLESALLALNVQLITVGLLRMLFMPAPPSVALIVVVLLALNVQLITVGLLPLLSMPAPL